VNANYFRAWHPDPTHWFALYLPSGDYTPASLTSVGTTATIATATDHRMTEQEPYYHQYLEIRGASPAGYNGIFRITVPDNTHITYTLAGALSSPATGTITYRSPWDGNTDIYGYPGLDTFGRGQQLIAWTTGDNPAPAPVWPNQVLDPVYVWGNTLNGVASGMAVDATGNVPLVIVAGRDFKNEVKLGYTPYQYPHPLVSGSGTSSTHYVGIYLPNDAPVYPPLLGSAYIISTGTPQEYTATLPAPAAPDTYSMRLRNSTDQTVNSLLIQPFVVSVVLPQLTVNTPISPRSTLFITVSNYTPGAGDWLGIWLATDPSTSPPLGTVPGAASISMLGPLALGTYEIRLFQGAGTGTLLTSTSFIVSQLFTPVMTCTTPVVVPHGSVNVLVNAWDTGQAGTNYIGVFQVGAPNVAPPSSGGPYYLTPTGNPEEGATTFTAPNPPGTIYELRLSTGNPDVIKTVTTFEVLPESPTGLHFSRFELWRER
jgi:hypothetical protein